MRNVTFCALIGLLLSSCGSDSYDSENPENPRNWVKYGIDVMDGYPVYCDSANVFTNSKGETHAVRTSNVINNRYEDRIEAEFLALCSSKEWVVQSSKLYMKDGTTQDLGSPGGLMDATQFYSAALANNPTARLYRHLCDGEPLGN